MQDREAAPPASERGVPTTDRGSPAAQADAVQIGQIVETEFPKYDADRDGEIDQAEFGKWMVALRRATDPATDPQSAEVQTWLGQAFASADSDKSNKVSKAELTAFLAKGAS
jgi:Ca2+-binding EF-hand superfamily protein